MDDDRNCRHISTARRAAPPTRIEAGNIAPGCLDRRPHLDSHILPPPRPPRAGEVFCQHVRVFSRNPAQGAPLGGYAWEKPASPVSPRVLAGLFLMLATVTPYSLSQLTCRCHKGLPSAVASLALRASRTDRRAAINLSTSSCRRLSLRAGLASRQSRPRTTKYRPSGVTG